MSNTQRTQRAGVRARRVAAQVSPTSWQHGADAGGALFEFGQKEWCEALVKHGMQLLRASTAPAEVPAWGFSEEYCQCPARLARHFDDGRSVYWLMLRDGEVSGGTSVRDEGWSACRALPGFHVAAQWGLIAHASGMVYGSEGLPRRALARRDDCHWLPVGRNGHTVRTNKSVCHKRISHGAPT